MSDLSDASVSRRRALGWLAAAGGAMLWPRRLLPQSPRRVVEPESFGKFNDGRGDAAPAVNAAIAALAQGGGGTVRFRKGKTYLLDATVDATAVSSEAFRSSIAIPARAANLTIDLNGAILAQQSNAFTFGSAYRMFNDAAMEETRRPLDYTPQRGDTSIRVRDPSLFPLGTRVMLVSGNIYPGRTVPGRPPHYTPIAEMFVVTGARDGAVLIDRAVQKDHAIAHGKDVGLIDITDHFAENLRIIGPGRIVNPYRRAGAFRQVFGLEMRQVAFEGSGGFSIRGRDLSVSDCGVRIVRGQNDGIQPYAIAFDTGSNNITLSRFRAVGEPFCFIHLHEGLSNVVLSDIEIRNSWMPDPKWVNWAAISILGLSWNVDLENVVISNNAQGAGIGAAESRKMGGGNSGLTLRNITLEGRFRNAPLAIHDLDPANVEGVDVSHAQLAPGQKAISLIGARHRISGVRD